MFSPSRAVVTGGAGFIGSHMVDLLLEKGIEVTVVDDFSVGLRENLPLENPKLNIVKCGVESKSAQSIFEQAEIVFHLAVKNVRASLGKPIENFDTNANGTLAILESMRKGASGRFVYFSSSEIYGSADVEVFSESSLPKPTTVYAAGKLAGEHLALAYNQSYGMNTRVIRPFNHFGPRSHFGGDSGELIPKFILRSLSDRNLIIHGDGKQTRDFSFVLDTPKWFLEIATDNRLCGKVVNIGSGSETSVNEIAQLVLKMTNSNSRIIHESNRPGDLRRLKADTSLIASYFSNYKLNTELSAGIKETIKSFEKMDLASALATETEQTWSL
jgi:UDP-glucose 4-epimerase